jgi:tRNA nucleotidyltransferase/poly(A) polymerase
MTKEKTTEISCALELLQLINAEGNTALIVGGAVRDHLLGRELFDIDIATDMDMEELAKKFSTHDIGRSKDFGIRLLHFKGYSFEVAHFREETVLDAKGSPKSLKPSSSFKEDAKRRDFTINAMGMGVDKKVIDHFKGKEDLEKKLVRAVGDPKERFKEDPLRILRAIRLCVTLGFTLEEKTKKAIIELAATLTSVASERIGMELHKMATLSGGYYEKTIKLLDETGLLVHILPEVAALKNLPHDPRFHPEGDAFEHTLCALASSTSTDSLTNLAILLHDIGKGPTHTEENGRHRYIGHEKAGVKMIAAIIKRLALPSSFAAAISFSTLNHMKIHYFTKMRPSKVFKLVTNDNWPLLKAVGHADQAARGEDFDHEAYEEIIESTQKRAVEWLGRLDARSNMMVISGARLMELTGLTPGPLVGTLLKEITDWSLDQTIFSIDLMEKQLATILKRQKKLNKKNQ